MSAFERLLAIADEETLDLAREMIGKPELALLLAKEALKTPPRLFRQPPSRKSWGFPEMAQPTKSKIAPSLNDRRGTIERHEICT